MHIYNTNYTRLNDNIISDESELYVMKRGNHWVTILEDYGNDRSYIIGRACFTRFDDATRAANEAFKKGYREEE